MAVFTAKIDSKAIKSMAADAIDVKIKKSKVNIEREKRRAFAELIRGINNHPITRELNAGAEGGTGILTGGYGNLFSFIGFDKSSDPVKVIINYIEDKVRSGVNIRRKGLNAWEVVVNIPTMRELETLTPMPWAQGRSWLRGIETGISGLGRYLFSEKVAKSSSRSGEAIQSSKPIRRSARFVTQKYMSSLLEDFERDLIEMMKKSVIK
tara:strand:+ start:36108 stop:36734 length:627 start_codon:yes stop_codon:yes gene_type:complete